MTHCLRLIPTLPNEIVSKVKKLLLKQFFSFLIFFYWKTDFKMVVFLVFSRTFHFLWTIWGPAYYSMFKSSCFKLSHFRSIVPFCTSYILFSFSIGFLMFSGGIKRWHWPEWVSHKDVTNTVLAYLLILLSKFHLFACFLKFAFGYFC